MPLFGGHRRRMVRRTKPFKFLRRRKSSGSRYTFPKRTVSSICPGLRNKLSPRTWLMEPGKVGALGKDFGITFASERFQTHMKWTALYNVTSSAVTGFIGTLGTIALNDLAHPNRGGLVGPPYWSDHDPLGVTEWSNIYKTYKVYAVTVQIRMQNSNLNSNLPCIMVQPSNSTYNMSGAKPWQIEEKPGAMMLMGSNFATNVTGFTGSLGQGPIYSETFIIKDVEGIKQSEFDGDISYEANFGNSPTKSPTIQLGCGDRFGTTNSNADFYVMCIFHVEMFNRITPQSS